MSHRVSRKPSGPVVHLVQLSVHLIEALVHMVETFVHAVETLVHFAEAHLDLIFEHVEAKEHLPILVAVPTAVGMFTDGLLDETGEVGGHLLSRQPSGLAHALRKRGRHWTGNCHSRDNGGSLPSPAPHSSSYRLNVQPPTLNAKRPTP